VRLNLVFFSLIAFTSIALIFAFIPKNVVRDKKNLRWGKNAGLGVTLLLIPASLAGALFLDSGNVVTRMGIGPDTSQNIMAAQRYSLLSEHSYESLSQDLLERTKQEEVDAALSVLRSLPNVRDQAFFDYGLSGFRGITTALAGEILRILGIDKVLYLQFVFLLIILTSVSLVVFLSSKLVELSKQRAIILLAITLLSPLFHLQFLNGAWAQLLTIPFLVLSSYLLVFAYTRISTLNTKTKYWLSIAITLVTSTGVLIYIEAGIVYVPLFLLSQKLIFERFIGIKLKLLHLSLVTSTTLISLIPYRDFLLTKLKQGFSGYGSTGIENGSFFTPWSLFGIGAYDSNWIIGQLPKSIVIASNLLFLLSLGSLSYFLNKSQRKLSLALILPLILIGVTSLLNTQGFISTYLTLKLSHLLFIVFSCLAISPLSNQVTLEVRGHKALKQRSHRVLLSALFVITIFSGVIEVIKSSNSGSTWSSQNSQVFESNEYKQLVSGYPMLTTYIGSATWFGIIGEFNWINKAPNIIDVSSFGDQNIRIICFDLDPNCSPNATPIPSALEKYGLKIWQTDVTAYEFSKLSPQQRFELSFKLTGQAPFKYQS